MSSHELFLFNIWERMLASLGMTPYLSDAIVKSEAYTPEK